MVLHDNPLSSNAQKVRFLLEELGLAYRSRLVELREHRPSWHLAVNPTGGVPVLVDDGVVLAESNAILRYLARRESRQDLYPQGLLERARVDWLLDAIATTLRSTLRPVEEAAFGLRRGRGLFAERPEPEAARTALACAVPNLLAFCQLLDKEHGFACFGRLTLADFAAAPSLHRLIHSGLDLRELARMQEWGEAVLQRPAWRVIGEGGITAFSPAWYT